MIKLKDVLVIYASDIIKLWFLINLGFYASAIHPRSYMVRSRLKRAKIQVALFVGLQLETLSENVADNVIFKKLYEICFYDIEIIFSKYCHVGQKSELIFHIKCVYFNRAYIQWCAPFESMYWGRGVSENVIFEWLNSYSFTLICSIWKNQTLHF